MKTNRRHFLQAALAASQAPAFLRGQQLPKATYGAMVGDVSSTRATVWSRSDKAARMMVEWKTSETGSPHRVTGPVCGPSSDFTGRVDLEGLPPGQTLLYRVWFEPEQSRGADTASVEPARGIFRTAAAAGGLATKNQRFLWSGDVAGQGWGINPEWGGMRGFEAMRLREPDFFIHSGDTIYADVPIVEEVKVDGGVWKNVVTPAKSKVAETLDEFRGCYQYNLMDENVRRFNAEVAQIWQWDDHEVMNNWSPGKDLSADKRYSEKDVRKIVARAKQAFCEYSPTRLGRREPQRIHRRISYGPLADVFVLDMRSFRGPNTFNRQPRLGGDTAYLGRAQMDWLKRDLAASRAVWKVIAADMPIGLLVGDGKDAEGRDRFENCANGDGPILGREFEAAELLRFIKQRGIHNTFWLTADVHYTAAHTYDPKRAQFADFLPFWEFVSGPLHAGTFGPGRLDNTFGPEVVFEKSPPKGKSNLPPSAGYQFFGEVNIDAKSRVASVTLRDIGGAALFTKALEPA